jgi:predicted amidophosphoribosyltransferase
MSAKDRPARRRIAERLLGEVLLVPDPSSVEGRRVLVVDDVCVSGATLLAVSRALRQAGAEEVCALVLARASWRRPEP